MQAPEYGVALGVVRRSENVGGLQEADKLFEVRGHEQGTVVGDD